VGSPSFSYVKAKIQRDKSKWNILSECMTNLAVIGYMRQHLLCPVANYGIGLIANVARNDSPAQYE